MEKIFISRRCPLVNSEICESGYLALSQLANSIHELVRGERAKLVAIDTSNVNTCRLDIFVRYDVAGPRFKGFNGTEENRATCTPDPRKPTLNPTTDLHDDITRCHGRICKRILAIHIYRMANATGRRSRRSVRLFRALSLSPPVTVALLTLSVLAPCLPLSFNAVHPALSLSLCLCLVTDGLSWCAKCAGLAEIEGCERAGGWRRNPLSAAGLPSHGKIFALLSINSSGKLKFSVTSSSRLEQ